MCHLINLLLKHYVIISLFYMLVQVVEVTLYYAVTDDRNYVDNFLQN